eukprot:c34578_g1_i1 orf=3-218(-)
MSVRVLWRQFSPPSPRSPLHPAAGKPSTFSSQQGDMSVAHGNTLSCLPVSISRSDSVVPPTCRFLFHRLLAN